MTDYDKLQTLCTKTYKEQAVWFLNCFWEEFAEKEAELLWAYVLKNEELDLEHHKEGSGLDEMKAHVFLERFDETLTVRDMRDKLRATGAIGQNDRPKLVPLTHYLLYKYKVDWKKLVDERRQGDNKEELEQAERLLAEVQAAFRESESKAAAARAALIEAQNRENAAVSRENDAKQREAEAKASEAEARAREAEAKASESAAKASEAEARAREADARSREAEALQRENEAREAEAPFKAAQEEVSSALAEVHKQESEYQGKIADCERRSSEGGVVQQNKAKAELAQLKAEDPLPLRKAKITLEAAEKRAAKARAPFEAATKVASDARAVASEAASRASDAAHKASQDAAKASQDAAKASQARQSAERDAQAASQAREQASQARQAATEAAQASARAKEAADAAVDAAANRLQEAEAYVNEVRSKPGVSFGSLWWIDRELHEQRKYLPTSRGGIAK